ncbi:DUF4249 domain-containing protein [Niabella drilacis]|uniref:DUF4249 domain-containing protein n=1 Tax=Niabella drilacis (strain DSM 25811 / CCM 8410 / CCUG 62505 / LMG 26954 / E90) TaxID=1285928 RepID=A0A1G6PQ22_NIADE|nr:DUF4249 domain-containing protein [Niabella drilacis]SDC81475.1 protein of unknown function [Niabella drilacis]
MKQGSYFQILVIIILCLSCKDRYYPGINAPGTGYLVVEGTLNAGNTATSLLLSRTAAVNGGKGITPELNASVAVEGNDNSVKQLIMNAPGNYQNTLELSANNLYRVRIKTSDGKEYLSDFVPVKKTPEIDSIGWKQNEKGMQLYVNTHDPANSTVYYRWDFDETWEINSYYHSSLIYDSASPDADKAGVRPRIFPKEDVFYCWKYGRSSNIYIGNSAKLTSDVIFQQPLNQIPAGDERLSVKYSILLRQYAMDKAAYEFYDLMKKNTESIGDIFGPLPSELRGNIHCTSDPGEPVIGYISATAPTQKRVFISRPDRWPFQQFCETKFVIQNRDSTREAFSSGVFIPIENTTREPRTDGYSASSASCIDCTARGGNLQKPSYWP